MLREIIALSKLSLEAKKHPLEKILLTLLPIILLGFSKSFLPIIVNILVFSLLHVIKNHPFKVIKKFSIGTALFASISSITFVLDYGIIYTSVIILKAFSAGMCISYLVLTTPLDDILNMCHRFDYFKDLCDIAKNMERFIILIEDEYNIMINSVKSRNGFANFKLKVRNMSKIAGLLFINTMRRWGDLKDSINTRCYKGSMSYFTNYEDLDIKKILYIVLYNIILLLLIKVNVLF